MDAGIYDVFFQAAAVLEKIAFNYDRRESNLSLMDAEAIETLAGTQAQVLSGKKSTDFSQLVGEQSKATALWKWCIFLVLLFLGAETLLLRFWKG